ncbi:competence/damage-inducible protein A [Mechercharimyces sp. CAU 1602]|uniref:competence/damage-inducible protein A n=1 Tax=Mechercharimyces sp. CAU 1602 TaxID=2973933 RepID=UPI0021617079|nr:competence/damage-inducible protein A [Mechercharimyces sp. CAU 1602]MCS1351236.1 competence/damage-inducible protein A [Mechercharimyces sp. CAU 1602]
MRAEIIAVGTELLLGQIVDTHAAYLSQALSELGIDMYYHTTVGDNQKRLEDILMLASSRSDLVILTGGLGPTEDDLTKEAVAAMLNIPLVEHAPSLERIETMFRKFGRTMPPANRKQALMFKDGIVFENRRGTAPGMGVTHKGVTYILMPGPPHELKAMFERTVRPYLVGLLPQAHVVHSKVLRFYAIGESHLEEEVGDLIKAQSNPTIAPLAKEDGVTLRLTAKATSIEEATSLIAPVRQAILERVGAYCYGEDDESLEQKVVEELERRQLTLALAESCTGGLLAQAVTSVPGSSKVLRGGIVCYTNEAKHQLLGVSKSRLQQYGAVSGEVAADLAEEACARINADVAISITGVAGPDSVEGKEVGTVYIGLAETGRKAVIYQLALRGTRRSIQRRAANYALFILMERIQKGVDMHEVI